MSAQPQEATRVLIVDDDAQLTASLKSCLEQAQYSVRTCTSAREAFQDAKAERPAIVVLDVMLGDGLGYQVARQLRSDPQLYRTPILYMSSLGEEADKVLAFKQGGDEYLTKPFNLEQILGKLDSLKVTLSHIRAKDPVTGLPSREACLREADRRLLRGEPVSLLLFGLLHAVEWERSSDSRSMHDLARHCGAYVQHTLRNADIFECKVGHLGRAMFAIVTRQEDAATASDRLSKQFHYEHRHLHKPEEIDQDYFVCSKHRGTYAGYGLLSPISVVVNSSDFSFDSASQMLQQGRKRYEELEKAGRERVFAINQNKRPR